MRFYLGFGFAELFLNFCAFGSCYVLGVVRSEEEIILEKTVKKFGDVDKKY